jgi:phage terminase large subunit-like protein
MTATATPARRRQSSGGRRRGEDPVTKYAKGVVDGRVQTGRSVRLQCERHLRDLSRQKTREFPFVFSPETAQYVIDFYPTYLTLENGSPFRLIDWQEFSIGSIFGWLRPEDGGRRFQTGYIETAKGSGKSPMLAGVGLYGLGFDDEQSAEIYSAAFDRSQASIIINDALRMLDASDDLREEIEGNKFNLSHAASRSFMRAVSSEHRSKSGPRPHMVLCDELHEHRDGTVVNKMRAGFKSRRQPLFLAITNSGHDRTSICWTYHQHSLSVLEQTTVDEQWFAYVCHLDPCARCYADGWRQPKPGCKRCDDWTSPKYWKKPNPSLGITIKEAYLESQVNTGVAMPSEAGLVKRLNFCIWTETHQVWIPSDRWDACRVPSVPERNDASRPAAAGLDLSSKTDLSALVVAIRVDDPPKETPAEKVTIEGRGDDGLAAKFEVTLNFSVELVPFFWIPAATLLERVTTERIPYDVWRDAKKLFETDGDVIDHEAIYDFIVKDVWKRFKLQRVGYDPRDATMLAVALRDRGRMGTAIVEVGQGKKLSETFKLMEILIRSRRLRHDGHPVLAWNIANAEPHRDRLNALWIEKPSETKRIDGAIGAAMAINQLMVLPAKRSGGYNEGRGLRVL